MKEGQTYHIYQNKSVFRPEDYRKEADVILSGLLAKAAKIVLLIGLIVLVVSFAPSVWYSLQAGGARKISQLLIKTAKEADTGKAVDLKSLYQPKLDPSLPLENRIKIGSAKINTTINEATLDNYEEALTKGVWRVADFGTPFDRSKPTILAAHRFGYLKWSVPYRLKNSFYSLPKLKAGETVEIVWKQRKYVYEVYGESEGEAVSDYSADLILYTCESLNSPVRIFRYARLLTI